MNKTPFGQSPQTVKSPRLSDIIIQHMTKMIGSSQIKSGDQLPSESQLSEYFGVSKTVVREALRELATLGLLETQQGKPATVRSLNSETLQNFFNLVLLTTPDGLSEAVELRRILEVQTVALAAERVTPEELDLLRTIVSKLERDIHTQGPWIEADTEFHLAIAKVAKNTLLYLLMEALRDLLFETIRRVHQEVNVRNPERTFQQHLAIFQAIEKKDPIAAQIAMAKHFDASQSIINMLIERINHEKRVPST